MARGMAADVRRLWVRFGPSVLLSGIVVGLVGVLAIHALLDSPIGLEGRRRSLSAIEIDAHRTCEEFVRQRLTAPNAARFAPAAHPDVRVSKLILEWVPFMATPVPETGTRGTTAIEMDRQRLAEYENERSGEYYFVESVVDTPNGTDAMVRSRFECEVRWPGTGQRWRLLDFRIGASGATTGPRRMR